MLVGTAGFELATPCTPCKGAPPNPLYFNNLPLRSLLTVCNDAPPGATKSPRKSPPSRGRSETAERS
ncbi:hypothetical protein [Achromobacter phage CF418P1]|nr:hypothetical protein [Achromobacter phage CF418P1]